MSVLKRLDPDTVALMDGDRVLAKYLDGCGFCRIEREQGNTFFPPHNASPRCESGGRNHCTCAMCF